MDEKRLNKAQQELQALNSPDPERNMYPTWIDEEGKEWYCEPNWEICDHDFDSNSEHPCYEPVEYTCGRKQLCSEHFAPIKARAKVLWREY